jgi:hypothetical protein
MADGEVTQAPTGATPPVPEQVRGANIPYRGIVDHGVDGSDVKPEDEAHYYDNARPVEYVESEADKAPEPVPVVVVRGRERREVRAFGVGNIPLTQFQPYMIVGRDIRRTNVIIRNPVGSAGVVFIGPDNGVSAISGYPLAAGEERNIGTTEPVWVRTDTALVNVLITTEYTKEYE